MVTIRLARFGRKKRAFYRAVVLDSTKKVSGSNLGVLGFWDPTKNQLKIDENEVARWVKSGAQISVAVQKLLSKSPIQKNPKNKSVKETKTEKQS